MTILRILSLSVHMLVTFQGCFYLGAQNAFKIPPGRYNTYIILILKILHLCYLCLIAFMFYRQGHISHQRLRPFSLKYDEVTFPATSTDINPYELRYFQPLHELLQAGVPGKQFDLFQVKQKQEKNMGEVERWKLKQPSRTYQHLHDCSKSHPYTKACCLKVRLKKQKCNTFL